MKIDIEDILDDTTRLSYEEFSNVITTLEQIITVNINSPLQ